MTRKVRFLRIAAVRPGRGERPFTAQHVYAAVAFGLQNAAAAKARSVRIAAARSKIMLYRRSNDRLGDAGTPRGAAHKRQVWADRSLCNCIRSGQSECR